MFPVPVVLGVNMLDVAKSEGVEIDPPVLAAALNIPVIPLVASRNEGVAELLSEAARLARDPAAYTPVRPDVALPHRDVHREVAELVAPYVPQNVPADWAALKLLEGDQALTGTLPAQLPGPARDRLLAILAEHEDAVLDIAGGRYDWIGRMVRAAVRRPRIGQVGITDHIDRVATHPVWGMGLLLAALALVFFLTFSIAGPVQDWLDTYLVTTVADGLRAGLAGAPTWVSGLLADGIVAGAGIVITFVPILLVFFLALGVLEDTGYQTRMAYVMDRYMHRMGLHGKSFLPLMLGFGCNVPAVMGARVIESRPARLITILITPLVPCSARLLVLAFLVPVFFPDRPTLVASGLVAVNLVVLGAVGLALDRWVLKRERVPFIMEMPLYHVPNLRTIVLYALRNVRSFLSRAATIIVLVSALIWALGQYPGPELDDSLLASFGRLLAPVGDLMGLDWRLIVATLTGLIAKENALATLGILYGSGTDGLAAAVSEAVTPASALAFLVVNMLFVPCVATIAAVRQETGSWRWTLASIGLMLAVSLAGGVAAFQLAQGRF
jgi:ferrous iron transport protein B